MRRIFLLLWLVPIAAHAGGSWSCVADSTGYAEFDHNSAYNSSTFTITLWFKQGSAGSAYPVLISRNNEGASPNWNWYAQIHSLERSQAGWNDAKTTLSNTSEIYTRVLTTGVWYRYQYRLRDETNRYVEHKLVGDTYGMETGPPQAETNPTDFTDAPIQLCRISVSGSYNYDFDGQLAHVELFDTWLDDGAMLFNEWHPGRMTANQVMYLPLTGTSIDDISSTNNDPSTTGAGMSAEDGGPPIGWNGGLSY